MTPEGRYREQLISHIRTRWRSQFGTVPLQLQPVRAQRRSPDCSYAVVRHHLIGPQGKLGYVECDPGEPVPAEAHALAVQEAPVFVDLLTQRLLLSVAGRWEGDFPELVPLEARYTQARMVLGRSDLQRHSSYVRCVHNAKGDSPQVLWTFRREIDYTRLLNAGHDVCTLITLWRQACEAHFQEVLGA